MRRFKGDKGGDSHLPQIASSVNSDKATKSPTNTKTSPTHTIDSSFVALMSPKRGPLGPTLASGPFSPASAVSASADGIQFTNRCGVVYLLCFCV